MQPPPAGCKPTCPRQGETCRGGKGVVVGLRLWLAGEGTNFRLDDAPVPGFKCVWKFRAPRVVFAGAGAPLPMLGVGFREVSRLVVSGDFDVASAWVDVGLVVWG
jgi:hypothetical protein